jgi:tetratricopeptide (TPR) repeat protein
MRLTFVPLEVSLTVLLTLLTTSPALADRTAGARNQGFQLYEAGRYQEAIGALNRVLEKHPRDIEALIKRGNCYLRLDQPARALPDFDRVVRYSPLLPGAITDRGVALLMLGRNDEALESFNRAVRAWKMASFMDPGSIMDGLFPVPNTAGSLSGKKSLQIIQGHATAHSGLGQAYHRMGQDEQAVVEYNRAIEIYALDPNAYIGRGDCRVSLGDHDQALADYNEAIRLGPDYSRAYASRGKLLEAMGQDAQAEADYDRAIQLDPSFTYALRLRAALLSRRGQNDRAIADIEASTRLRPDDASGFKDRGGVLVRLGQYQRAIDTLNRAIELDPNRAAAYLNRGAAYNGLGQYERAIDDLNKAIALDPKNPGAHTNIGLAYYMIGQYDRAIEDLSEAVRLAPGNAIVHLNRGNVYARLGFKEQAVGDYETVTRLDPRLIAFYGGAAKLLEDMGRNNLAIRDEKKLALQSDPAELELHVEQGNALRAQGDWKGAIAEFDRVIERDPQRAEAYVARGWARFCAGEAGAQTDARSFLNLKGWRDRLSPYMALLGFLGSRRDGKENDARTFLDEAISSSAQTTWPVPVLRFLRHDISANALLEAAASDTQKTEAHTFLALELLQRGDLKKAREHLTWVREKGASRSIATDLAKATLERLDHPQEALSRTIEDMLNR